MASLYPTAIDAFSTAHLDGVNEIIHALDINNNADAVNKIEAELGTFPKGKYTSVKWRLNRIEYPLLNLQIGTAYTLVLADASALISMNNAAANTLTIPPNTAVAFPYPGDGGFDGCTQVIIRQAGAGQTLIAPGSGVTLHSRGGVFHLAGQYAYAMLTQIALDIWELSGDIVA